MSPNTTTDFEKAVCSPILNTKQNKNYKYIHTYTYYMKFVLNNCEVVVSEEL